MAPKDNYRNVPIIMPPEEDDASIRIAQRRKRRGDYDGVDDRGPRKRGRKPKKEKEVCGVNIQIRPCCEGAPLQRRFCILKILMKYTGKSIRCDCWLG